MSNEEKIDRIRLAIQENGKLPIKWNCGYGDQSINFGSWGEGHTDTSHPHHKLLDDLFWIAIDKMLLHGGAHTVGRGDFFVDPATEKLKLEFESTETHFFIAGQESDLDGIDLPDFHLHHFEYSPASKAAEIRSDPTFKGKQKARQLEALKLLAESHAILPAEYPEIDTIHSIYLSGHWNEESFSYGVGFDVNDYDKKGIADFE